MATTPWLSREQAAAFLTERGCPIAPQTLANMAKHDNSGKGPPFYRTAWNRTRYHADELEAWRKKRVKRVE